MFASQLAMEIPRVASDKRNGIGKSERWHRISETGLGKAKGGIAYAKSNWEKRKAASHI